MPRSARWCRCWPGGPRSSSPTCAGSAAPTGPRSTPGRRPGGDTAETPPDAAVTDLPDSGHVVPLEAPEEFAAAVLNAT